MRQQFIILYVIVGFLTLLHPEFISARDAPITTAGAASVCPGAAVIVPVTVTNFTSICAISLRLDFNPTLLTFDSITNLNPSISGASVNAVNVNPTLTKILMVWANVNALTFPDDTKLLNLNFTLIAGSPVISFNNTSGGGGDCEYADENGMPMNDIPTATFYINSTITNLGVAAADTATGAVSICSGTNDVAYSIPPIANAAGYIWTVPPGAAIVSGDNTPSVVVNYSTSAESGNITVAGTNDCGTGTSSSLPVTIFPLPVPVITGMDTVCAGSTGNTYTTDSVMTNYSWSVSSGGIITAGTGTKTVTVDWNAAGSQNISVSYTNSNGCTAGTPTSEAVTVSELPVPTITGPTFVCAGSTGNVYTTEPGMTGYLWNISTGGTVTGGGGTADTTITITWDNAGARSVSVNYTNENECSADIPSSINITVSPLPGAAEAITGNANVCAGDNEIPYSTPAIADASSYSWMLPAGATISTGAETNSITVNFDATSVSGDITVFGNNSCGNGASSPAFPVLISQIPAAAGTITGDDSICAGATEVSYQVPVIADATSYTWSVPAGAVITSGLTTNTILVTFGAEPGSGIITVYGTNTCGTGATSPFFNVSMNAFPEAAGTITGLESVCAGATEVSYQVPVIADATSYTWSVPAGAVITSGLTTNTILVTFGAEPGPGIITVFGTNSCGSGTVSPSFDVMVNAIPDTPVVTAAGAVLTSSATTGNQWYHEVTGAIAGETGQTFTVTITGSYYTIVTLNDCVSSESNHVNVVIEGRQDLETGNFSIYPTPNDGRFTVSITGFVQETFTIVVYNQIGAKICELGDVRVNGTFKKQIDLHPVASGIYSVVFLNRDRTVVRKVLVR